MNARIVDTAADARWWAYTLLVKDGIRLRDSAPRTVVAVFLPTRALPWWCLFRPAERCLVLHADLSVDAVGTAGVPWVL